MRLALSLAVLVLFLFTNAAAQDRCGTVVYEQLKGEKSALKRKASFENWMGNRMLARQLNATQRTQATPYVIPVVVHVIHNGEPIGTGTNISVAQIQSQIDVLNADYKRLNADAANTPPLFQPVAGSMDIRFVLAKQDAFGVTSNGIVRVKGSKSIWRMSDDATLKAQSYWRSDLYLNIWVTNLDIQQVIGYAQFPDVNKIVGGLEDSDMVHDMATDGVVIHYRAFGSGSFDLEPEFNKGRTATHEIGHFLGLRHIWGDNPGCATDYVNDTPPQSASTSSNISCSSISSIDACTTTKMFQNYMDYSADACMNLFTKGQMDRMDIVINNGVRRKSLLTSPGATPSTVLPQLDIAVAGLRSPGPVLCLTSTIPQLTVKNQGNIVITSFKVETILNSGSVLTQPFTKIQLLPGEEKDFALNTLSLKVGMNTLQFTVTEPNGQTDNTDNNSLFTREVVNQSTDIVPLRENFNDATNSNWTVVSPQGGIAWEGTATNFSRSLSYKSFSNTIDEQQSWLVSPTLNLNDVKQASIIFDLSYARRPTGDERLQVLGSTDCGLTYTEILYDEQGKDLSVTDLNDAWMPSTKDDWQPKFINLETLISKTNVRLAFVVTNRNGNNLFLDNIEFYEGLDMIPPKVEGPYYVYATSYQRDDYQVTFNLEKRSDVSIYVYNMLGDKIAYHEFANVLNQTYSIDLSPAPSGIYILRTQIGNELSTKKIFVAK
jgi:Pregnancy-associated plasma protein-A/Secretion system C-terminal sorting domain